MRAVPGRGCPTDDDTARPDNFPMSVLRPAPPRDITIHTTTMVQHTGLRWDVFCRVVDNYGDIGVCWRLCADLAGRGQRVRLWVDDATSLRWMAPQATPGVQVLTWPTPFPAIEPGDVVIEAFACDPPASFVAAMARASTAPVWINLEYLSAEDWVERVHGLPSPQWHGPGKGLTKWFFHPGFTPATGGLLREPALRRAREDFDTMAWRHAQGLTAAHGERLVTLFCYPQPALPALVGALGAVPTLLATTPGHATQQMAGIHLPHHVRHIALPWLSQPSFDRLLWSADLNFVRGEDSAVRALWAGRPFVWQLYPQEDRAHAMKARAFLTRWRAHSGVDQALDRQVTALWEIWNGLSDAPLVLPGPAAHQAWEQACRAFAAWLAAQDDLSTQLLRFVEARRTASQAGVQATPHPLAG